MENVRQEVRRQLADGLRPQIVKNFLFKNGYSSEEADQIVSAVQDELAVEQSSEHHGHTSDSSFLALDGTFLLDAGRLLLFLIVGGLLFIRIAGGGVPLIDLAVAVGIILTGTKGKLFTGGALLAVLYLLWILFEIVVLATIL